MTRIAQLSDIHFGSESVGAADRLAETINAAGYDLVVLSGDLTMAARHREFFLARRFMDALDPPVLSVPGNHDITPYRLGERFFDPYRRWRRYVGPTLEPDWVSGDVAVVGVNTARRLRLGIDWSRGSISRRQIAEVGARFAALGPHKFRIVVAHHPFMVDPATTKRSGRPASLVRRAAHALKAFAAVGVDLVLAGHLHKNYAAQYLAKTEAGGDHTLHAVQAGTALSSRLRGEGNSFSDIVVEDGSLTLRAAKLTAGSWEMDETPLVVINKASGAGDHTKSTPKARQPA